MRAALAADLRPSVLEPGQALPHWSLRERMQHYGVPGVAIAVFRDGRVVYAEGYGVRASEAPDAVDADTLFSVGSVSKVVTAATTLRLVARRQLDLDRDVDAYLRGWQIPVGDHPSAITLRMLLSHTAGLNVHGFADYAPGARLPTLLQTLQGVAPAQNEALRRVDAPGTRMRYSGGGVMVEQKAIEDRTGRSLERVARAEIFAPLGMDRSGFLDPSARGVANVAMAHDADGRPVARPRGWQSFPELAASGLWTSANDLARFVAALIASYQQPGGLLPQPLALDMMSEVQPSIHGLGPRLGGSGAARYFHHGGANDSYRAWIEGHLVSGDGLVILSNGARGSELNVEIRNAIWDALDPRFAPPVASIAMDLTQGAASHYPGRYRSEPLADDLRGNLAAFEAPALTVAVVDGRLQLSDGDETVLTLRALTPSRFIATPPPDAIECQFLRNAQGEVYALVLERDDARLYFRRDTVTASPDTGAAPPKK
ncbi:serine hydrolase domain-containing protein [Xanthomonas tesorieronis]|uniref:serine hydrolase domain-containing protein n=1 Tax=Xanthomonas tesorieronis TaxID=3160839 RepID=UPI003511ABC6